MSGVCVASDIWSVGCTVIELLTGLPPYYDLGPWPALWQIAQDTPLPIPDSFSPVTMDFVRQCLKKVRNNEEGCPEDARTSNGDDQNSVDQDKVFGNDKIGSPNFSSENIVSREVDVEESSNQVENYSSSATSKSQEYSPRKHGFVPLVELLEVPNNRVICSVLQVLNEITRDSTEIQEHACLAGLIPTVMGFAVPDHPHEIRMEAAKFLHQLCHSSCMTLHMFVACRGIPILVSFLEADYTNHREMVHLAIDGLWQVLKLQWSSSRLNIELLIIHFPL
ncbi:hypothetical protein POM88_027185 [Heracleum sosnowskyi]|uniref:Protein kinase domain-containing protein n=1 Tax=Heracleum sosnowskyi TaxID=360622 RepID=A0AAD8I8G8_9APIA|nr:hypothetical protein POM88_027185 [Heracleum sosnowskyi]